VSSLSFPGLWKFAGRNGSAVWSEFVHDISPRIYARELRRYLPEVLPEHLKPGPMGVRAQAMGREGQLLDDFVVRQDERVLHVLSAPSPAATSSLASGEYLCDSILKVLSN